MTGPRARRARVRACAIALVGLLLLPVLDRALAWTATRRVHAQLRHTEGASGPIRVKVAGVPFLTQVAGGNYRDLRIDLSSIEQGGVRLRNVDVRLRGVHVGVLPALAGRVRTVPVDDVEGTALLTYADLQDALRRASIVLTVVRVSGDADGIRLTTALTGSRFVLVRASVDGGVLSLHLTDRGDAPVALRVLDALPLPLPALPYGLRLEQVHYDTDGIRLEVIGSDARFSGG